MLRDMTIGQYYQTDSILHRLDPRVKIVATFVYIISLFLVNSFGGYIIAACFLIAMILLSHVPFSYMIRGMRSIVFLLLITVLFNLFLTPGEVIAQFWKLKITREGLAFSIKMGTRLIMLILGCSLMTLTTTPNQLTDAIESLLGPLKKLHVPVHEIAMMMSIALRFIPILLEETDKIMKAQMARGADFESGSLMQRMKNLVPLLVRRLPDSFGIVLGIHGLVFRERPTDLASGILVRDLAVVPAIREDMADAAVTVIVDNQRRRDTPIVHFTGNDLRDFRPQVRLDRPGVRRHVAVGLLAPARSEIIVHRRDDVPVIVQDAGAGFVGGHPADVYGEIILIGLERLHRE